MPQGGDEFGLDQLIDNVSEVGQQRKGVRTTARELSQALKRARGGITSDDATLLLVEWRGGSANHLAMVEPAVTLLPGHTAQTSNSRRHRPSGR
ncbi:hypothetical protein ACU686_16160 [Yinghuangia aomiensis]